MLRHPPGAGSLTLRERETPSSKTYWCWWWQWGRVIHPEFPVGFQLGSDQVITKATVWLKSLNLPGNPCTPYACILFIICVDITKSSSKCYLQNNCAMMKCKRGSWTVLDSMLSLSSVMCDIFLLSVICWSKAAGRCPLGARKKAFIYRKQSWIMTCNATVVRVNSLEVRDQFKQDWAPDQSCWQTQQHCRPATVSLPLFPFCLCRGTGYF